MFLKNLTYYYYFILFFCFFILYITLELSNTIHIFQQSLNFLLEHNQQLLESNNQTIKVNTHIINVNTTFIGINKEIIREQRLLGLNIFGTMGLVALNIFLCIINNLEPFEI